MNKVCVLLSTYNGNKFLCEQLESVLAQKEVEINLFIRDDGSRDGTQNILEKYKGKGVFWYQGENVGAAKSYLDLISNAPVADYYAFCDQDDFWLPDKLNKAISCIESLNYNKDNYCLYYSNVIVVDSELRCLENSNIIIDKDNLCNILLHNYAIGCTVVFNKRLLDKIRDYKPEYIRMHDWWLYQVCLVLGGTVVFDKEAHILYRQHGENCVGYNLNQKRKINIFRVIKNKPERVASRLAEELLNGYGTSISEENYYIVYKLAYYHNSLKLKIKLLLDNRYFKLDRKSRLREKIPILFNRI